uniref:Gamma-secretase-activating protein C-terminal domain-containing protein n=1 Tax=Timema shepardi TaxID=629360 RepID=A0A7R9B8L4_TIMSH|nr:unnamed protein product [Timema shepardi]
MTRDQLDEGRRYVLFVLLERFYLAVNSLAFPLPQGFTSFFTFLGYRTLAFPTFLQYTQRNTFELQVDVMKAIMAALKPTVVADMDDTTEGVQRKLRLLLLLPRSRAKRLLNQWAHPVSFMLRAREHALNILSGVEGAQARGHPPQSVRTAQLGSRALLSRRCPVIELVQSRVRPRLPKWGELPTQLRLQVAEVVLPLECRDRVGPQSREPPVLWVAVCSNDNGVTVSFPISIVQSVLFGVFTMSSLDDDDEEEEENVGEHGQLLVASWMAALLWRKSSTSCEELRLNECKHVVALPGWSLEKSPCPPPDILGVPPVIRLKDYT